MKKARRAALRAFSRGGISMVMLHIVQEDLNGNGNKDGGGHGNKYHISYLLYCLIHGLSIAEMQSYKTDITEK